MNRLGLGYFTRVAFPAAVLISLCALAAFSAPPSDPWLILASGETGTINVKTTRRDLVRYFGAANVVDREIELGEGEVENGTVVFPQDSKRMIEILWKDFDAKNGPKSATIHGKASNWKAVHSISLGTSLKQLEQINGKPFHLAGFDWDYSGTVMSWDGGSLERDFEGKGRIIVRLSGYCVKGPATTKEEQLEVAGDRDFSSHHPVMQKIDPCISEMVWVFP